MTPTAAQLQGLVLAVRKKASPREARYIGVRTTEPWQGEPTIEVDGETWRIVWVRSTLEARRALLPVDGNGRVVLLTPLDESELGIEVLARFPFPRLETIQPWQAVRELFKASKLDPRVTQHPWMAAVLLQLVPAEGYAPAPTGVLDLDTIWRVLLGSLGLATSRPAVADLLEASADGQLQRRWEAAPQPLRENAAARLTEVAGSAGGAIASCLLEGRGDDLIPVGLIIDLLGQVELSDRLDDVIAVRTRLERFGVHARDFAAVAAWGDAAVDWCRGSLTASPQRLDAVLERAEEVVRETGAQTLAVASPVLRSGLSARLVRFADALRESARSPDEARCQAAVEEGHGLLADHVVFAGDPAWRTARGRAEMALRLSRWLGTREPECSSLPEEACLYRDQAAWADRARFAVLAGEADPRLMPAYQQLASKALERREGGNRRFAARFERVLAGAESSIAALKMEDLLETVVAPLAQQIKVLVVVMDGMSHPIFQQIADDLGSRTTLDRQVPDGCEAWPPVITPLPSVTTVCRTSLLCGRLANGGQDTELSGFDAVAARLGWRGAATSRRILFHKAYLAEAGGGLAKDLREAIGSSVKVIAVILNAVDDQLAKGDQLQPDWNLKTVPLLEALVSQAEVERRALVLVADHGHVVESGTREKSDSEHTAERWRPATTPPGEEEIEVRGERVVATGTVGSIVVPWSEQIRYVGKRAGYHGGASPQEVVAPLAVFVPVNAKRELKGWRPEVVARPHWWTNAIGGLAQERVSPPVPVMPPRRRQPEPPAELFEPPSRDWIGALLSSEVYRSQRRLAGRTPPDDAEVRETLGALDAANGAMTLEALRTRVRVPALRLRGKLTALARVLNVDGFAVLEIEEQSGTVRLNRQLLATQFELGAGAAK